MKWYETNHSAPSDLRTPTSDLGTADPFSPFPPTPARPIRDVAYQIYLRAGLLEYLHEQYGAALGFFEKAKPFAPSPQTKVQVIGKPPSTGIERLIEAAKTGKTLTPDIVRKGDSTAKLAMMLADIYHEAREYEKSLDLCNRLLTSAAIKRATPEQRSYAYYKRARNTYLMMSDKSDPDPTIADYLAAVSAAPRLSGPMSRCFLPPMSIGIPSKMSMQQLHFGNAF